MQRVILGANAMGTRFEIVLYGDDAIRLRAAGQGAMAEIHRLDAQLSFYRADSDIADLNRRAAYEPVYVDPRLFRLLELAKRLSRETSGAFDVTVAPLMQCWTVAGDSNRVPTDDELSAALCVTGEEHLILDEANYSVRFTRPGVMIDLGAIGKGYAIDSASELLRESGFETALLHGGTSSIVGMGSPPDAGYWNVAIRSPLRTTQSYLESVALIDASLSVSAPHGKWLVNTAQQYGHVLDPRSGEPVGVNVLSAVTGPSATAGDALSTALLVLGKDGISDLLSARPAFGGLVCMLDADGSLLQYSERIPFG